MVDIAEEAGASRQSIYRFFEDRSALILYIVDQRITGMAEALRETFAKYQSLEEALVEGSIASLKISREDTLYSAIVATSLDLSIEQFMLRGGEQITASMISFWGPLIDRARDENKIVEGLTNADIVEWIRHVHTILTMRNDMDDISMRRMLQRFVVPSVIRPSASRVVMTRVAPPKAATRRGAR